MNGNIREELGWKQTWKDTTWLSGISFKEQRRENLATDRKLAF